MKKLLLILLCLPIIGFAQTVNDIPIKDINVKYVQIVGTTKFLSKKVNISIDFGQKSNFFSFEPFVKDSNGKKIVFNSMIDALNFMYENGYEFKTAYTLTVGNQNVYHFLLKKNDYLEPQSSFEKTDKIIVVENSPSISKENLKKLEKRKKELKKLLSYKVITEEEYDDEINKLELLNQ
tara:strand:+ start:128 stop:664 length:537 start_codon:yes stop_codon:yes gene_type:complete